MKTFRVKHASVAPGNGTKPANRSQFKNTSQFTQYHHGNAPDTLVRSPATKVGSLFYCFARREGVRGGPSLNTAGGGA